MLDAQVEAHYAALSEQEIRALLAEKWFAPLAAQLEKSCHSYSKELANRLKTLDERYAETLDQIRTQREQSEQAFWAMAAELLGGNC